MKLHIANRVSYTVCDWARIRWLVARNLRDLQSRQNRCAVPYSTLSTVQYVCHLSEGAGLFKQNEEYSCVYTIFLEKQLCKKNGSMEDTRAERRISNWLDNLEASQMPNQMLQGYAYCKVGTAVVDALPLASY